MSYYTENCVTKYAKDVVEGKISDCCKYTIKACERHLKDLEKSKNDDSFQWVFDEEKANNIIDFAELLTFVEGGQQKPVVLKDFQKFILGSLNGWKHKKEGYRRFKYSFVSMSRKNGRICRSK